MRNLKYDRIADKHKASEKRLNNALIAFISGGFIGFLAEVFIEFFCIHLNLSRNDSIVLMIVLFIFVSSLLTALGIFDKLVGKCKCGLLIPITGFAHSMTSAALDYKEEGPVYGVGSNIFKLSGSVILYGVFSSWLFGTIRYLFEVIE